MNAMQNNLIVVLALLLWVFLTTAITLWVAYAKGLFNTWEKLDANHIRREHSNSIPRGWFGLPDGGTPENERWVHQDIFRDHANKGSTDDCYGDGTLSADVQLDATT